MYSNEINDMLQTNLYALRKVYQLFARNKNFAHRRNLLETGLPRDMPTIDSVNGTMYRLIDNIGENKLCQAYYLCK